MTKLKFGLQYWNEPTPRKIRRVAGALSALGVAGSGFAYLQQNIPVAITLLTLATVGAFFSKLFAENP
jgi:hypothetical protein